MRSQRSPTGACRARNPSSAMTAARDAAKATPSDPITTIAPRTDQVPTAAVTTIPLMVPTARQMAWRTIS